MALALPMVAALGESAGGFAEQIEAEIAEPEMRYRPYARWWLADDTQVIFRADSFEDGTAAVFINGTQVPVNMDRRAAELTGFITKGGNTTEVRATPSLHNKMREVDYDQGWISCILRLWNMA